MSPGSLALVTVAASYLLGSIPFGLVLTRLAGYGDIRTIGSGNIGATNVLRTGSKGLALATLLLDAGKGAVAVLIARQFGEDIAIAAAAGAIVGHLFPVWLRFKGGKGVATAAGVLLAIAWPVGLVAVALWLAVVVATRYSSAGALAACAAAPVAALLIVDTPRLLLVTGIALLVALRHRTNIGRLIRGEESRVSFRKS